MVESGSPGRLNLVYSLVAGLGKGKFPEGPAGYVYTDVEGPMETEEIRLSRVSSQGSGRHNRSVPLNNKLSLGLRVRGRGWRTGHVKTHLFTVSPDLRPTRPHSSLDEK